MNLTLLLLETFYSLRQPGLSLTLLLGHLRTLKWLLIMGLSQSLSNFLVLLVMMFVSRYECDLGA